MSKKWCVRHRDGWCATSRKTPPQDSVVNQKTVCKHYVVLPLGIKWGRPTCTECIVVLTKAKESTATDTQQLKAKIAALVAKFDKEYSQFCDVNVALDFIERMRQLSAV